MASRDEAARAAQVELAKLQKVRGDEKAWKAQAAQVSKAEAAYRATFNKGR